MILLIIQLINSQITKPNVTNVAECNKADTGVVLSIAFGNHTWTIRWTDLIQLLRSNNNPTNLKSTNEIVTNNSIHK